MPFIPSESDRRHNKRLVEDFLYELTELSNKYGVCLKSCGCCNSIWMEKMEPHEKLAKYECDIDNVVGPDDAIADEIDPIKLSTH